MNSVFKPGQLVVYRNPPKKIKTPQVGLVKRVSLPRRRGEPRLIVVEWCTADPEIKNEQHVYHTELKLYKEE